jgi:hypothetical protein
MWERGYFRSTLAGAQVQVSAAAPAGTVVFDARLQVPVPVKIEQGRAVFFTWLPLAQGAMFALAPQGKVRLFGPARVDSADPKAIARTIVPAATQPGPPAKVEVCEPAAIAAFLKERAGKEVIIGYGGRPWQAAAETLAAWLTTTYNCKCTLTMAGPRCSCRYEYMDGFGYPNYGPDPVKADVVIGNCQDTPLLYRYLSLQGDDYWLPLEVNQDFPGPGRALIMLSAPVATQANGQPNGKAVPPQLVIGASYPDEARQGIAELLKGIK